MIYGLIHSKGILVGNWILRRMERERERRGTERGERVMERGRELVRYSE